MRWDEMNESNLIHSVFFSSLFHITAYVVYDKNSPKQKAIINLSW